MKNRFHSVCFWGIVILILTTAACSNHLYLDKSNSELRNEIETFDTIVKKRVLIYRTVANFSNYVPVLLDSTKNRIIKFTDFDSLSISSAPTPLKNGYLLDNWQIDANVAFLEFTYNEYSKLKLYPIQERLLEHILVKHPLDELWDCGEYPESELTMEMLNELIDSNFINCTPLFQR